MAFHKILCPVDFSPGSQRALAAAARLARAHGGELIVLHAWALPSVAVAGEYFYPAELVQDFVNDAQRRVDVAVAEARALGAPQVTGRVIDGPAWRTIVDTAKLDPAIDVIVIGTHGRTGVRRVLLGSVAEAVVRHASCPVLTLRPEDELRSFRHVLCPIDFSPASRAAVELAGQLAEPGGKGIVLVHALELPSVWGDLRPFDADRELSRIANTQLAEWASELAARVKLPVVPRVLVGRPGGELLAALDADRSIDLVVIGNRGRTGLARMALGSVAEKIVRHAHCPVLVAHAEPAPVQIPAVAAPSAAHALTH
ncbi:MAG TPA: universal stress protein [Kofleriaceae bacterium]|nr:universal stress protein [Kofleriaceae bacterium]